MKTIILIIAILAFGKMYSQKNCIQVVKIGEKQWTTKNLNSRVFMNGDSIFLAKNKMDWMLANSKGVPACAYYDFDSRNADENGLLYNWYAINDSRGIAPPGFHIPSEKEFEELVEVLGGHIKAGNSLKSNSNWKSRWPISLIGLRNEIHKNGDPYRVGNGSNESEFNALPSGFIQGSIGKSQNKGEYAYFWTSTKCERTEWDEKYDQPDKVVFFGLKYHEGGCGEGAAHWGHYFQGEGMSVRCVADYIMGE